MNSGSTINSPPNCPVGGGRISGATQSLGVLGISESEERTYRWLLSNAYVTAGDVARALSLPARRAQQLLDDIESKGFATHTPERPRRYRAASPDIAIEASVSRRRAALDRVLGLVPELRELTTRSKRDQKQTVELITGRESERQILEHMLAIAEEETLALVRLPLRMPRPEFALSRGHSPQREAQARGVSYRSVVDVEILGAPNALSLLHEDIKAGEDVRVASELPFKMVLVDRRVALIPLDLERSDSPSLLVRSSTLLSALHALFELLWERASPISLSGEYQLASGGSTLTFSGQAKDLFSLMATGLNDKHIASELGVTTRTLQRRVTEQMQLLDARSRFQLGWLAALHLASAGSIEGPELKDPK